MDLPLHMMSELFPNQDQLAAWMAISAAGISMLVLFFYYIGIFGRFSLSKGKEILVSSTPPVSVIVCARNEMDNLQANLPLILDQHYPEFQVVVVNDCSWDETEKLLTDFELIYPNLKVVTIQEQARYEHGKKFALTLGIKAANYECLVLTDADCIPEGKDWLKKMTRHFTNPETEIVLGYGAYQKNGSWLNKLIRYDAFHTALQYFSFAKSGNPYMGVGRNLAYKKSLFFEKKGFASHQHILSGDDDLFVNEASNSKNTAAEAGEGSITYSVPKKTFSEWVKQKSRHFTTSPHYRGKHQIILGTYWLSQFVFLISITTVGILLEDWKLPIVLLLLKFIIQYISFGAGMKKLKESDLIPFLPFLDLIILIVSPTFAAKGWLTKRMVWK